MMPAYRKTLEQTPGQTQKQIHQSLGTRKGPTECADDKIRKDKTKARNARED